MVLVCSLLLVLVCTRALLFALVVAGRFSVVVLPCLLYNINLLVLLVYPLPLAFVVLVVV